jgi:Protein of unknown function (DUF3617)
MRSWCLIVLLAASPAWADIEPGSWELTVRMQIQGMTEPQTITQVQCLTPEQAKDPGSLFGKSGPLCEFSNRSDTGSTFTFDVACSMQMRGKGSVRYTAQSLEGDLEIGFEGFSSRSRLSGRRLGGC